MKLTEEEKQLIIKKRQKEEDQKAKKIGYLKHDLFILNDWNPEEDLDLLFDEKAKSKIILKFQKAFELVAHKGAQFDCYIDEYNQEQWYDQEYGIEGVSSEWAKKHLTKIKNVK